MPIQSRYVFSVSMDVEPGKEALFNEIYDQDHIPILQTVPGVISVTRFKTRELTMILGGERKTIAFADEPKYNALYELESPAVLLSDGWAKAVDAGRWTGEVRPFTRNRRHILRERM